MKTLNDYRERQDRDGGCLYGHKPPQQLCSILPLQLAYIKVIASDASESLIPRWMRIILSRLTNDTRALSEVEYRHFKSLVKTSTTTIQLKASTSEVSELETALRIYFNLS